MKKIVPWLILALGVALLAKALRPQRNPGAFDVVGFGKLPVLANGRIKPLDTVARSSLLQLQSKQFVVTPDGRKPTPIEWLLDVFFRSEVADTYQVIQIDHPDVLALLDLKTDQGRDGKRFALNQLSPKFEELDRQAKKALAIEPGARTAFQGAVVELREKILLYFRLKHTLAPPNSTDFLSELMNFQKLVPAGVAAIRAKQANQPHDEELAKAMIDLGQRYLFLSEATNFLAVPPADDKDPQAWKNTGQALLETFQAGELNVGVLTYAGFARAWRQNQPEQFNGLVPRYRAVLEKRFPVELKKCAAEARFNAIEPFYVSMNLYVLAFLVGVISWLKWPDALGKTAWRLVALAWLVATTAIGVRVWLQGYPPVTNLYSSAPFIGWVAVALCLVLEWMFRNAIASVAAGLIGFSTLVIAHYLSLGGDTMEMMRAVLDSNFWLTTHVLTVTAGYAATFLAGFLALLYIFLGLFTGWIARPFERSTASVSAPSAKKMETNGDALARMVYGVVCFATLFSFVGTVLGGVWADQSWGRFWGWDPKENGALIIVIWNAIILHARWGGMIKHRGLMALAIFGNIVTSWSWFGTNLLGVGLHNYGFQEGTFWALLIFIVTQLAIIGLACIPLEKWRSFKAQVPAARG